MFYGILKCRGASLKSMLDVTYSLISLFSTTDLSRILKVDSGLAWCHCREKRSAERKAEL